MSTSPRDYRGRRALVFGASGFIGRWMVRALDRAGAEIHVVARDAGRGEVLLAGLSSRARVGRADLAGSGSAARVVAEVSPDIVFNLAAYGVRPAERDPATARRMNVDLVAELGEALASRTPDAGTTPVLVHVGTAAEYGTAGGDLNESGPASPASLYGATKLEGTRMLERLAAERGLRAVVARPFTVYGPGEPSGRLLPTLLDARRTGRRVRLTSGTQRRDFIYVEDVAEGLLRLGDAAAPPGLVVNLATGNLLQVRDFVLEAAAVLGLSPEVLGFGEVATTTDEMEHEPPSTERLARLLGWRPATTVAEGVRRTREHAREESHPA